MRNKVRLDVRSMGSFKPEGLLQQPLDPGCDSEGTASLYFCSFWMRVAAETQSLLILWFTLRLLWLLLLVPSDEKEGP